MGIMLWIAFGLIAGIVAKWIMPGSEPGGIITSMLVGVVGALIGGMLGTAFGFGGVSGIDIRSLMNAIGGALVLLFGFRLVASRWMASQRNV